MLEQIDSNTATTANNQARSAPVDDSFGAHVKNAAQWLHSARYIYHSFAILDSLSSSYTMFKYFFDILVPTNDPTVLHDYIITPEGIAAIVIETVFLVGFSYLASLFDVEDEEEKAKLNMYQIMIVAAWPFCRDLIKGLKNAYKGFRSAVQVIGLFASLSLNFLIIPVGVTLGILAAVNRLMLRDIIERRKVMKKENENLLYEIMNDPSVMELAEGAVKFQKKPERYRGFVGAAIGGIFDGLYMYMGVLLLCALSPQVLIFLSAVCIIYTLSCIVVRIFEEHVFQMEIVVLQTKCEFNLVAKKIKAKHAELIKLTNDTTDDLKKINQLKEQLCELTDEFDTLRSMLIEQTRRTYGGAFLVGLKDGLFAYSALSSAIFVVVTILSLCSIACPPLLLMITVPIGLVFLAGFIINALVEHRNNLREQAQDIDNTYDSLMALKRIYDDNNEEKVCIVDDPDYIDDIKTGLNINETTKSPYPDSFEIGRSFFSGITKGQRWVEFAGNSLQVQDAGGQYRDSPILLGLVSISSAVFAVVLALRAFAKGFGKAPNKNENEGQATPNSAAPEPIPGPIPGPIPEPILEPRPELMPDLINNNVAVQAGVPDAEQGEINIDLLEEQKEWPDENPAEPAVTQPPAPTPSIIPSLPSMFFKPQQAPSVQPVQEVNDNQILI